MEKTRGDGYGFGYGEGSFGRLGGGALAFALRTAATVPSRSPSRSRMPYLFLSAFIAANPISAQSTDHPGKPVYDKWCAGCHGLDGKGGGSAAAYMLPRPRDFTLGQYQIRSTASGELPTDADLMHVVEVGMPGTAMPGWREQLSNQERQNLVAYVKTFSRFFQNANPQPVDLGRDPGSSAEVIAKGREVYQKVECWKCHGQAGRGDGQSAPTQQDDAGFPIRPADLTEPWHFNGGGTVQDIFRRLKTGLTGTPMPSFMDAIAAGIITEEDLWSVAHFVRSLAPEDPVVREVVRAARVEGAVPSAPDDSAWANVERFYIPLVGQIIVKPRWFAPAVDGVWVQALHNGQELALRLSWSDPSRSPSPEWAEWRASVENVMEPKEDMAGAAAVTTAAAPLGNNSGNQQRESTAGNNSGNQQRESTAGGALPDVIAVQFPRRMPSGMDRPYFLMGNAREPVYLWRWQSQPDEAAEMLGRGIGRVDPLPGGANAVSAQSVFDEGQWRVVLRRGIAATDTANAISFPGQQPVPMAIFAWDGDNGEAGTRGAISTWYFIYLDEPTSGTVYATPLVAMLLTAGLGVFVVGRAQKREREHGGESAPDGK